MPQKLIAAISALGIAFVIDVVLQLVAFAWRKWRPSKKPPKTSIPFWFFIYALLYSRISPSPLFNGPMSSPPHMAEAAVFLVVGFLLSGWMYRFGGRLAAGDGGLENTKQ